MISFNNNAAVGFHRPEAPVAPLGEDVEPRQVTTAQKLAITNPRQGTTVFDTTLDKLCVFTTTWETITSS